MKGDVKNMTTIKLKLPEHKINVMEKKREVPKINPTKSIAEKFPNVIKLRTKLNQSRLSTIAKKLYLKVLEKKYAVQKKGLTYEQEERILQLFISKVRQMNDKEIIKISKDSKLLQKLVESIK